MHDPSLQMGLRVKSGDGKYQGVLTGGSRNCMHGYYEGGCKAKSYAVKWETGRVTYPCGKKIIEQNGFRTVI